MQDKFKRLSQDSVIYGIGGVVNKFIAFLLLPIYTRVFSPSDYGTLDIISTMTSLASMILTAGIGTALSYYFYKFNNHLEQRKTVTASGAYLLIVNGFTATGVFIWADSISYLTFGESSSAIYIRWAVLSIPFSSFVTLNLNLFRLRIKPWAYVVFSISQFLLSVLLNIYLIVILQVGIIGVYWAQLAGSILFAVIGIFLNRHYFGLLIEWRRLAQLLRFGSPLIIGGISLWSINYLDRYFLLRFVDMNEIGLYSVGLRLASAVAFITQAFRTANAPFQFEVANEPNAHQVYSRTLTYYILLTSLICVPLSLFARPVLRILTTPAYVEAYRIVPFAAFSAVAYGLYQIVGIGLLVTKKTGLNGMAKAIGAFINVAYLLLLVPSLGIMGAALATLLTHTTVVILLFIFAQRAYAIPFETGRVLGILGLAGLIIAVGLFLPLQNIWLDSLVGSGLSTIFLAMIFGLLLRPHERQTIWNQSRKRLKESWKS